MSPWNFPGSHLTRKLDPGTESAGKNLKLGTQLAGTFLNPEHLDSPESIKNWPRKSPFSVSTSWPLGGGAWTSARGGPGNKSLDPGTESARIGLKLRMRPAGFILNTEHLDSLESVMNWPRNRPFSISGTWWR